jgi:hypothetical protein
MVAELFSPTLVIVGIPRLSAAMYIASQSVGPIVGNIKISRQLNFVVKTQTSSRVFGFNPQEVIAQHSKYLNITHRTI